MPNAPAFASLMAAPAMRATALTSASLNPFILVIFAPHLKASRAVPERAIAAQVNSKAPTMATA
jgi:hypothetical protein